jgi:hypothetical protein
VQSPVSILLGDTRVAALIDHDRSPKGLECGSN